MGMIATPSTTSASQTGTIVNDPFAGIGATPDDPSGGISMEGTELDFSGMGEGLANSVVLQETIQNQNLAAQTQRSDVQLNPLPSLPSISNVGSVPFTGTVSNIPGGFQPLPQVAGGRKKLYQLSQFHGGINQKSSPRDISDQECQEAENISFSDVGKIKLLGDCLNNNVNITIDANDASDTGLRGVSGYGLFQFAAPAAADGTATAGSYTIILTPDGDRLDYYDVYDDGEATFLDYGGNDETDVAHVIYAAGNGLYANDANFTNTNNKFRTKIYVHREDQNETVSGWREGAALVNSPLSENKESGTVAVAGKVNIEDADLAASNDGSMNVCIVAGGAGGWDGEYFFYVSWLFDGGCETGLTAIGTETFAEGNLSLNPSLVHTNAAPLGGEKRIEGGRIYFKEAGTAERWLLAEFNLADGVKGALDSTFTPWTLGSNVHDLATLLVFDSPPSVYSYSSLNGYYANEVYTKSVDLNEDDPASGDGTSITGPTPHDLRYKTAVVGSGGIVFIGNVKFKGKVMADSMMFSMPGKPGVFPQYNRFDSPSSDGSPITVLASFRDKILQFKQDGMYVINVSNPNQFYAEASFRDCGVFNPCQVFTTSFGVIFANKFGCYIYDGRTVTSLTHGKFSVEDWAIVENSAIGSEATLGVACVGYDPRSQNIIVLRDIGDNANNDDAWVYNMLTRSWSESVNMIDNADGYRFTNFIITSVDGSASKAGYLTHCKHEGGVVELLNYNHIQPDRDQTINYTTKDLDFGLPSQTKKIFKVYVTYVSNDSAHPTLYWGKDGAAPTTAFDSGEFQDSGGLQTTEFKVTDADLTGIKSLSLKISGATDHEFEIQDISILYRVRPIK